MYKFVCQIAKGIKMSKDTGLLYSRIEKHITGLIESGTLKEGDRLPSEPALSRQFNASRIPVRRPSRLPGGFLPAGLEVIPGDDQVRRRIAGFPFQVHVFLHEVVELLFLEQHESAARHKEQGGGDHGIDAYSDFLCHVEPVPRQSAVTALRDSRSRESRGIALSLG